MQNKFSWSEMMEPTMKRTGQLKAPFLVMIIACLHVMAVGAFVFIQGCGTQRQFAVEPPPAPVMPPKVDKVPDARPISSRSVFQPAPSEPAPAMAEPQEQVSIDQMTYTIKKGDTLSSVASKFDISWKELAELNKISNPGKIRVGQKLIVPAYAKQGTPTAKKSTSTTSTKATKKSKAPISGDLYVVKPGDTLSGIAVRAGTTTKAIKAANGLKNDRILVGQKLKVAGGAQAVAPKKMARASMPSPAPKKSMPAPQPAKKMEPRMSAPKAPVMAAAPPAAPMPAEKPKLSTSAEKPLEYTVREGDRLEDIAKRYLVRAEDISAINDLADADLKPGQQLLIPTGDF